MIKFSSVSLYKPDTLDPCEVESKVSDLDCVVKTPGRKNENKTQLCHVNVLKAMKLVRRNLFPHKALLNIVMKWI